MEVWVIGHVFLYPGPTVDLLVCWRDDEEAGEGTRMGVILMVNCMSMVILLWCYQPVLAGADHAAVVLVASPLIQHAGVDDMSDGNIQVVGTQMLQQVQGLVVR